LADINTSSRFKDLVDVYCTNNGKKQEAELIQTTADKIVVILPGFIKMTLYKTTTPHFYAARQSGLEFTCSTKK